MPTWGWIVIAIAIVVIVVLASTLATMLGRSRSLRRRFGPEYDRTVDLRGNQRLAEAELAQRTKRHEQLSLRPLSQASARQYQQSWYQVQSEFVDNPIGAVGRADALIQEVMRERGYPAEDFDQRTDDLSVEHPEAVEDYRLGHLLAMASANANGQMVSRGSTEDLRRAMRHYRSLFEELVEPAEEAGEPAYSDGSREAAGSHFRTGP